MPQPPFDRKISEGSGEGAGLKVEGTEAKPFGEDFLQEVLSVQWGAGHYLALAIITTGYERYDLLGSPFAIGACCNTTLADWQATMESFPAIISHFLPSAPSRRVDYPMLVRPGVASDQKGPGSGLYKGLYGVTEILMRRNDDESIDIFNTHLDSTVKTEKDTFTNDPAADKRLGDKKAKLQTGQVSKLPVLKRSLQNTPSQLTPIDPADLPGVPVPHGTLRDILNSGDGGAWYAPDQQTGGSVPTTKENVRSWIIQDPYACHIRSIPDFDFTLDHIEQYYGSKVQTNLNLWSPKILKESWCFGIFNIHHSREECAAPSSPDLYNGMVITTVKGEGFNAYAEPTIVTTDRVDWSKVQVQYKKRTYEVIGVNSYFNGLISILLKVKKSHDPPVVGDIEPQLITNHP